MNESQTLITLLTTNVIGFLTLEVSQYLFSLPSCSLFTVVVLILYISFHFCSCSPSLKYLVPTFSCSCSSICWQWSLPFVVVIIAIHRCHSHLQEVCTHRSLHRSTEMLVEIYLVDCFFLGSDYGK